MRNRPSMQCGIAALGVMLAGCVGGADEITGSATQAVTVCHSPVVEGVDVSTYQGGSIDWNAVHASGREFAITRINDGVGSIDPTFTRNWDAIRAAGMIRGAYQFYRPNDSATTQANIVCSALGHLGPGDLPAMLDLEVSGGQSAGAIIAGITTWLDQVETCTGKHPLIYTAGWFWNPNVNSTAFGGYPLVVAAYGPSCPNTPNGWSDWKIFQYSDGDTNYTPGVGPVPGIGQSCDRDRFAGTLDDLRHFADSNRPPIGYLDSATCTAIAGWAQDPDAPDAPIAVHVYLNGPAGDPNAVGFPITAGQHRDDLCAAIGSCNHGYTFAPPYGFWDNAPHAVYTYGIDSAGGANAQLSGAPMTFQCAPPTPPLPPTGAVRRHVPNPDVLAAWRFSGYDVARLDDSVVNGYPDGPDLSAMPDLVQGMGDSAVYTLEYGIKRHIPSPDVLDAWRFSWDSIQQQAPADVNGYLTGADLLARPFLMQGSGPAVYLVDAPPPLWGEPVATDFPASVEAGGTRDVTLTFRNRGSMAWAPGNVWLAPLAPRGHDSALCDASSWSTCHRAATVSAATAMGEVGAFTVRLRAPSTVGTSVHECWGLVTEDGHWFGDPGEMGPADNALCRDVSVVARGSNDAGYDGGAHARDAGAAGDARANDGGTGDGMPHGGCGCNAVGGAGSGRTLSLAGVIALALALRRRRRATSGAAIALDA